MKSKYQKIIDNARQVVENYKPTIKIDPEWDKIDFIIHAVAFSDKNELNGRYIDTSKQNFINTLNISCYSFTKIAKTYETILNPKSASVSFPPKNTFTRNVNILFPNEVIIVSSSLLPFFPKREI